MKLTINKIDAAVMKPDDVISFPHKAGDVTYSIELGTKAQEQLLLTILASTPVQSGKAPRRFFQPSSVQVFQSNTGGAGLTLYLNPGIGIHVSLRQEVLTQLIKSLSELKKKPPSAH